MKHILLLAALLFSLLTYSQSYEIGASEAMGFAYRVDGTVDFTDTLMSLHLKTKEKDTKADFDITNIRNGITYVTDGTQTFQVTISEISGKRKGYKYSLIMGFKELQGAPVLYYANPINN